MQALEQQCLGLIPKPRRQKFQPLWEGLEVLLKENVNQMATEMLIEIRGIVGKYYFQLRDFCLWRICLTLWSSDSLPV